MKGRLAYVGKDLHESRCKYHQSCSVNFRTGRDKPEKYEPEPLTKRRKPKTPKDLQDAFDETCKYLERVEDEIVTLSDLQEKMGEFLEPPLSPYNYKWMKKKLIERYGESIYIVDGLGANSIVTFRENVTDIMPEH